MTSSTATTRDEHLDETHEVVGRDHGDLPQGMLASPSRTRL